MSTEYIRDDGGFFIAIYPFCNFSFFPLTTAFIGGWLIIEKRYFIIVVTTDSYHQGRF